MSMRATPIRQGRNTPNHRKEGALKQSHVIVIIVLWSVPLALNTNSHHHLLSNHQKPGRWKAPGSLRRMTQEGRVLNKMLHVPKTWTPIDSFVLQDWPAERARCFPSAVQMSHSWSTAVFIKGQFCAISHGRKT